MAVEPRERSPWILSSRWVQPQQASENPPTKRAKHVLGEASGQSKVEVEGGPGAEQVRDRRMLKQSQERAKIEADAKENISIEPGSGDAQRRLLHTA